MDKPKKVPASNIKVGDLFIVYEHELQKGTYFANKNILFYGYEKIIFTAIDIKVKRFDWSTRLLITVLEQAVIIDLNDVSLVEIAATV